MSKKKTTKKNVSKSTSRKKTSTKKVTSKKAAPQKTTKPKEVESKVTESESKAKEVSQADLIWEEIKDLPINLFALPGKVSDHLVRLTINPNDLCLRFKSGAVIPSLEEVLSGLKQVVVEQISVNHSAKVEYPKYQMEVADNYILIKPFEVTSASSGQVKNEAFVIVPSNNKGLT